MSESLAAAKKDLRAAVLARRDAMSPAARATASRLIREKLLALPALGSASRVATYMSFGAELDTHDFFTALLAAGKIPLLPRIDRARRALVLHEVTGEADLVQGVWGIREPRADAPEAAMESVDFMLMPGLAFDPFGNRLGYGAGYYDRLLAEAGAKPLRVAAAFDCQVVDAVPVGASDRRVHLLLTESRTFTFSP